MVEKSAAAATSGAINGLNQVGVGENKNHSENGSLAAIMQGAMSALSNDKTIDSSRLATMTASVVNSAVSSLADMKMSDSSATQAAVGEIIKGSVKGLTNTSSPSDTTNSSMVGKIAEAATTALPAAGFSQAQIQKATEFVVATGVKSAIDSGVAKSSNIDTIVGEISAGTVKGLDKLVTTGAVSQSIANKSATSFQTTIVSTVQTASQSGSIVISEKSLQKISTTVSTAVTDTQEEILEIKNSNTAPLPPPPPPTTTTTTTNPPSTGSTEGSGSMGGTGSTGDTGSTEDSGSMGDTGNTGDTGSTGDAGGSGVTIDTSGDAGGTTGGTIDGTTGGTTGGTTSGTTGGTSGDTGGSNPPDNSSSPEVLQHLEFHRFPLQLNVGESIEPILPLRYGEIEDCTVNPVLPAGLSLAADCVITGSPSSAVPEINYVFTAKNSQNTTIAKSHRGLAVLASQYKVNEIRLFELQLGKNSDFSEPIQFQDQNDTSPLNISIRLKDASQYGVSYDDREVVVVFRNVEKDFSIPRKMSSFATVSGNLEISETFTIVNSFPPGTYQIDKVFVKNKFKEQRQFNSEEIGFLFPNSILSFQVLSNLADNTAPTLVQIGSGTDSTLNFPIYNIGSGGFLNNLEFSFLDDVAMPVTPYYHHGIEGFEALHFIKVELEHVNTKQEKIVTSNVAPSLSNEGKSGIFNIPTIYFNDKEPAGLWRIASLSAYDQAFNRFQYNASTNTNTALAEKIPLINVQMFTNNTDTAPTLNKYRLTSNRLKIGHQRQELLQAYISLEDDAEIFPTVSGGIVPQEELVFAKASYQLSTNSSKKITLQSEIEDKIECSDTSPYECSLSMSAFLDSTEISNGGYGTYQLISVELYDRAGNKTIVNSFGSSCTQNGIIDCASNSLILESATAQPINDLQSTISEKELSPLAVNDVVYDAERGVSYIATDNGLAISTSYGKKNQWLTVRHGLPSQKINTILKLDDALILGTDGGLAMSNDNGVTFDVPAALLGKSIRKLVVNASNAQVPFLILTEKNGVYKYQQTAPQFSALNNNSMTIAGAPAPSLIDIQVDASGDLYILSSNGIHRYVANSYVTPTTIAKNTSGLPNDLVAFHVTSSGEVLISTSFINNQIMYKSSFNAAGNFTIRSISGFTANSHIKSIYSEGSYTYFIHNENGVTYSQPADTFSITSDLISASSYSLQANSLLGKFRINKLVVLQDQILLASTQGLKHTDLYGAEIGQSTATPESLVQRLRSGINDIHFSSENRLYIANQEGVLESLGSNFANMMRNFTFNQGPYHSIEKYGGVEQLFFSNQFEVNRADYATQYPSYAPFSRNECPASKKIVTAIGSNYFFYACGGSSGGVRVFNLPNFTTPVLVASGVVGITDLHYSQSENKLLIGTMNGIKVYNLNNSILTSVAASNVSPVSQFSETSTGIYIVRESGLYKFNQALDDVVFVVDLGTLGLLAPNKFTSYTEIYGKQFIGTSAGVYESSNSFTNKVMYTNAQGLGSNYVSNLLALPNGDILITTNSGVSVLKPNY